MLDSRPRGPRFYPHRHHWVVSLSKNINPSLEVDQPRKTCPFITERLLMGCKESNQTKQMVYRFYCMALFHSQTQRRMIIFFISHTGPLSYFRGSFNQGFFPTVVPTKINTWSRGGPVYGPQVWDDGSSQSGSTDERKERRHRRARDREYDNRDRGETYGK